MFFLAKKVLRELRKEKMPNMKNDNAPPSGSRLVGEEAGDVNKPQKT